ncbi:hypothetical protein M5E88_16940 [Akkermansia muciniphila]|nr:hypothetical protein M5E88_16940 [Akkermansia muciniphila]
MDKRYNSSLTVEKGVLEITGGSTANASSFTLSGPGAVLRPGRAPSSTPTTPTSPTASPSICATSSRPGRPSARA